MSINTLRKRQADSVVHTLGTDTNKFQFVHTHSRGIDIHCVTDITKMICQFFPLLEVFACRNRSPASGTR